MKRKKPIQRTSLKEYNKRLIKKRKASIPSSGERMIMHFLLLENLQFKREYTEPGLRNFETGMNLFFDFFLPDLKLVIEFDGIHHSQPIKGEKALISQLKRDRIKDLYCLDRGYVMIRIDYLEKGWHLKLLTAIIKQKEALRGLNGQ